MPVPPAAHQDCTVRLAGIGGTGVVTVSQVLGTAAMLQGYHVRGLDQTGLSQKAGPVLSDVRLTVDEPRASNKATRGSVDVLLAFDQLVGGADGTIQAVDRDRTFVIANTATVATGSMVVHPERAYPVAEVSERLGATTQERLDVDAQRLAVALLGDDTTVNVFMLGVAVQTGRVPVDPALVATAIELNGVAVAKNLAAFAWGRCWVADPDAVEAAAAAATGLPSQQADDDLPLRDRLAADLTAYQSRRYAARFTAVVDRVASLDDDELTEAVTRNLHKLMAYKDEYEVARLLLLPSTRAQAEAVAGKGAKVTWHLHPPMLRAMGMHRKLRLGRWARPLMWGLRSMRRLRGTPFDVFGVAKVRRVERAMIREYVAAVDRIVAGFTPDGRDGALRVANLPDTVRGYEHLKLERAAAFRAALAS